MSDQQWCWAADTMMREHRLSRGAAWQQVCRLVRWNLAHRGHAISVAQWEVREVRDEVEGKSQCV